VAGAGGSVMVVSTMTLPQHRPSGGARV